MKKLTLAAALAALLFSSPISAQVAKDGGLSQKFLSELRDSYKDNPANKALRNAVMENGMRALVINSENPKDLDGNFSHKVTGNVGIADQQSSGRCWLFTGQNVLRGALNQKYKTGKFFFSQNYNYFYDQLEKSNLFLQTVIDNRNKPMSDQLMQVIFRNPINDGGQYTGISENFMKYGLVPASVMPETKNSNNTGQLNKVLTSILRQSGMQIRHAAEKKASLKQLKAMKEATLKDIYRVLCMNLGVPPTKFTYTLRDASGKEISTKEYTPMEFYKEFINYDLKNDYVMLMNDPTRPYYKLYTIDLDRHEYDGENWTYINVPMDDFEAMAIASIKGNMPMYYSCDVGKELDRKGGICDERNFDYASLTGVPMTMDKADRISSLESGSSHAMTLMAVDLNKDGKPTKWMVENSWGANSGFEGHLIMSDKWFRDYSFRLVVNKKFVPAKLLDILKTKPVVLPAWDPMF